MAAQAEMTHLGPGRPHLGWTTSPVVRFWKALTCWLMALVGLHCSHGIHFACDQLQSNRQDSAS
jgi:hypothetical protein